jgi:predicted transcriptional regulator
LRDLVQHLRRTHHDDEDAYRRRHELPPEIPLTERRLHDQRSRAGTGQGAANLIGAARAKAAQVRADYDQRARAAGSPDLVTLLITTTREALPPL